jgi:hypothetical protein
MIASPVISGMPLLGLTRSAFSLLVSCIIDRDRLQTPVIFSPEEHRNNHRVESFYADLSPRLSTSTSPIGGQGRGINPPTEQTTAFPRPSLGPSPHTAHYGSPGYHVNEMSRRIPQLGLPHIISQPMTTDHHYTQVPFAVHDQRACNLLGGQNAEPFHRVPAQRNIQVK